MASEEQWRREGDEETKRSSGEETVTIRSNGECNRYLSCSMAFFPTKPNSWAIAVTSGWTGLDSFKFQAQS
ncbi:hypothetical protein ACOSQ2_023262 [Xanthoceras sorbifolium]